RAAGAGKDPTTAGARAVGLANPAVTLADAWALTNNIGGLGWLTRPTIGVYADNRFGVSAFRTGALAGAAPIRGGQLGVGGFDVARFGDEIYSETRAGLGYAYRQGPFSLGVKADMWQLATEGLLTRRAVALSAGGLVQLRPKLWLGAYGYNLNQTKLNHDTGERLPTLLKGGLSYRPSQKLLVNLEVQKNVDLPAAVVGGLEYQPHPVVAVRAGFNALTEAFNFGLGAQTRGFQLDYALGTQSRLGLSHHVGLTYTFGSVTAGSDAPGSAPAK
ncbi:MAG: hypothetical protein H7330_06150, partial [Hymenobacteraceae bacterium]|nr:hypothetical protein [Hymenobacteraceae bacterium]